MLLTITTTHRPATDLGHLLHKSPERLQSFPLPFGQAHVFYPEAGDERCTAALLLDVDPVGLIRRGVKFPRLDQHVNDRPYVASSFLSVAISRVFTTALAGKSKARPELAETALPLRAHLSTLPCAGSEGVLRRLFEPLGYDVRAVDHPSTRRSGLGRQPLLHGRPRGGSGCATSSRTSTCSSRYSTPRSTTGSETTGWRRLRRGEGWLAGHPTTAS
jgi:3' terminal RNA ribose 2'-O-methyltransferase Hen1